MTRKYETRAAYHAARRKARRIARAKRERAGLDWKGGPFWTYETGLTRDSLGSSAPERTEYRGLTGPSWDAVDWSLLDQLDGLDNPTGYPAIDRPDLYC